MKEKIGIKEDDNTPLKDIDILKKPETKTIIDRYVFASSFCKGKNVLDAACGHGFGSMILIVLGANVTCAIDIDKKALNVAKKTYPFKKDIFMYADLTTDWKKPENFAYRNEFDVVVSVETFEHIPREKVGQMLNNFKYVCKKDGIILITTPIRRSAKFEYKGGTHLYEYNIQEFMDELRKVFPKSPIDFYLALEFKANFLSGVGTLFDKGLKYYNRSRVMIAIIKNQKGVSNEI